MTYTSSIFNVPSRVEEIIGQGGERSAFEGGGDILKGTYAI